jgi:hypothetical protein
MGRIRKLARGLYDDPSPDERGLPLPPTTDAIIKAIVGRDAIRIQPSGAHAANLLGLSEQVPVRMVFLTDGRGRKVTIGKRVIELRHVPPRLMASAGRQSGTVIQALRWLGPKGVTPRMIRMLRRRFASRTNRRDLLSATRHAPSWVADILHEIVREESA